MLRGTSRVAWLRGVWLRAASRHGAALRVHRRTRRALGAQRRKHHHAGFVRYSPNSLRSGPVCPVPAAAARLQHSLGSKALPKPMPRCAARLYVALNARVVAWHVTCRVARCTTSVCNTRRDGRLLLFARVGHCRLLRLRRALPSPIASADPNHVTRPPHYPPLSRCNACPVFVLQRLLLQCRNHWAPLRCGTLCCEHCVLHIGGGRAAGEACAGVRQGHVLRRTRPAARRPSRSHCHGTPLPRLPCSPSGRRVAHNALTARVR